MRTITKQEFLAAIRKNGYEQAFGITARKQNGQIQACALGQAGLNLNVNPWYLMGLLGREITQRITVLNDDEHKSLNEIANIVEEEYPELSISSFVGFTYGERDVR